MAHNSFFINHSHLEKVWLMADVSLLRTSRGVCLQTEDENHSRSNVHEAGFVVRLAQYLILQASQLMSLIWSANASICRVTRLARSRF